MTTVRFVEPFVFANGFFEADDAAYFESIGVKKERESAPVRFHIGAVVSWNYVTETTITVHMQNGNGYILDCPIDEFDVLMVEHGNI